MKILIIGSDSFIAKKFILKYGNNYLIDGISRLSTGYKKEKVFANLDQIGAKDFSNIEIVFNFAAIVHRPEIKEESIYDGINYKLSVLNAQKAKQAGVRLFIQLSTIAVYGNATDISTNTPYNPKSPYGNSKLKADQELLAMQDKNFKVAIVRPPMVYGGGKAPGNMMRLIKLADQGIPLPFKDIDNKRDFINVNNLIQYLALIAEKQLAGIHLISDQEPVSTEYLLKVIAVNLNKKVPLFKIPDFGLKLLKKVRPNEYDKLFGTLRIENNFPYGALIKSYSVQDGIKEMVEWFKLNKK